MFEDVARQTGARSCTGWPTRSRSTPRMPSVRGTRFSLATPSGRYALATPLAGAHQAENAAAAVRAAELLPAPFRIEPDAVARGVAGVRWPGRLERFSARGRAVLVDGCHNADGARALAEFLADKRPARATSSSGRWRTRTSRRWDGRSLPPSGAFASSARRILRGRRTPDELRRRFAPGRRRRASLREPRCGARGAPPRSRGRPYNRGRIAVPGRGGALAAPVRPFRLSPLPENDSMTTAAVPFTREHFERLEEERLAVYASKSARAVRPRGAAAGERRRRADELRARPRPHHPFARLPAPEAQDAGVHPLRGRPFPDAADAHDRGLADRAQRRPRPGAERGPHRGHRPRPRPRPHAVRPLRRERARPPSAASPIPTPAASSTTSSPCASSTGSRSATTSRA